MNFSPRALKSMVPKSWKYLRTIENNMLVYLRFKFTFNIITSKIRSISEMFRIIHDNTVCRMDKSIF